MENTVRETRIFFGISLRKLATASDVSASSLSRRERGQVGFRDKELLRIAQALTQLSGQYIAVDTLFNLSPLRPMLVCQCGAVVASCATAGCPTHQGTPQIEPTCGVCKEAV